MNEVIPKFKHEIDYRPYDHFRVVELEIEGERYGHLVAEEHIGFIGPQAESLWRFRCDCGRTVIRRAPQVRYAAKQRQLGKTGKRIYQTLHCGRCSRAIHQRTGLSKAASNCFSYYKPIMCQEWLDYPERFYEECWKQRQKKKRQKLVRIDTTRPLGPDNFLWDDHSEQYYRTFEQAVQAIMKLRGLTYSQAYGQASSLTRERRRQLTNKAKQRGLL